ncbi:MAG: hypothetical protein HYR84_15870 [Planctomycetes bacterium]|nr:hypothetical protein [Planctomycetota bacterium]
MNLPQLVGQDCAACNKSIGSIADGMFCEQCGNPVHVACQKPDQSGLRDGRCARCCGDPAREVAAEVRKELAVPELQPPVAKTPVNPASDHPFAEPLAMLLRFFGGLLLLWTAYTSYVIVNATNEMGRRLGGAAPDVSGPLLLTILAGVASAVLMFALAEILKMGLTILSRLPR